MRNALLRKIDERRELDLAQLQSLVAADTSIARMGAVGNEMNGQKIVMEILEGLGATLDIFEPEYAAMNSCPEVNPDHDYAGRPNVVGTIKGTGGGRSLLINGHIDTVSPEADKGWTSPPLQPTIRDGKLYGRGTCDMKGGLSAALSALAALRDCGIRLKGDVVVESVVDEEGGGNGTLACCCKGYRADAAIVPEPSQLQLTPAHMGWLFYRVAFVGRAIHCAFKWKGVNAIEKCLKTVAMLQEMEREWAVEQRHPYLPPPTVSIGRIDGGIGAAIVPDRCGRDFSVHYLPRDPEDDSWMGAAVDNEVRARLGRLFASDPWLAAHPPQVDLIQLGSACDIGAD
ncbi:MAG: M20/M25/M40 family metallo-hydrolase, partial [Planctomycetes bacterium]|nr:M20/M25/M40 family metallo-hydrolase [Planctomycetota bacterium]